MNKYCPKKKDINLFWEFNLVGMSYVKVGLIALHKMSAQGLFWPPNPADVTPRPRPLIGPSKWNSKNYPTYIAYNLLLLHCDTAAPAAITSLSDSTLGPPTTPLNPLDPPDHQAS